MKTKKPVSFYFALITVTALFLVIFSCSTSKQPEQEEVVVYTSVDQIFSEPILKEFEQKTGIKMHPVFDTEASKTTGLVNRLIAEKSNPQADVFWNSEITRTLTLKKKGVLAPYSSPAAADLPKSFVDPEGYWAGFATRARVIIYNTDLMKEMEPPQSILDLTDPKWKGKAVMATPLFGTTATHAAVLFAEWGAEKAKDYFLKVKENDVGMLPGNSNVRDRVAAGQAAFGMTDTDDVNVAFEKDLPVEWVFPDQEGMGTLVIPNTVALIKGAPHPETAKKVIDYLLSPEVEAKLAQSESVNIPLRPEVKPPERVPDLNTLKLMEVDFEKAAEKMDETAEFIRDTFLD